MPYIGGLQCFTRDLQSLSAIVPGQLELLGQRRMDERCKEYELHFGGRVVGDKKETERRLVTGTSTAVYEELKTEHPKNSTHSPHGGIHKYVEISTQVWIQASDTPAQLEESLRSEYKYL